ncbi:MAG: methylenetetrahydrofolate reductase [Negativicutes bacterium]|nr:methylenetetrahydrofolate reductase [Negativicutes bacterium]
MRIVSLFSGRGPVVSCEIFPPRPEVEISAIFDTLDGIRDLAPDFVSVTYGAGGGTAANTIEICRRIISHYQLTAMAHFTCVGQSRDGVDRAMEAMAAAGVDNVLALRGDPPQGTTDHDWSGGAFAHANQLIAYIAGRRQLGIAAAAYPEGHVQSRNLDEDIYHIRGKVAAGAEFLVTQLFFDNRFFYHWREKAMRAGISCPVTAGIFPVLDSRQLGRIVQLCGVQIPRPLAEIISRYGHRSQDMRRAGIDYACRQIVDLLENQVEGIHLYTMNKPQVAREIFSQTGLRKPGV